ncbi:FkbM family methyltransferase [Sphingomonas crusticola]|uniref:FkbM family methyltransferase n=1 Tax=Sphingomonas crusticola TaxID=1697973 RepID=UPI000E279452|nr:FkbM family methyltransferase [Sphingomonas crusticola]
MLNLLIGSRVQVDGGDYILTQEGVAGCALYGPYERLAPGNYTVEFSIAASGGFVPHRDLVCAIVDVVAEQGKIEAAFDFVFASQLAAGEAKIVLPFTVHEASDSFEYRVHVNGSVPLLVASNPTIARVNGVLPPVNVREESELLTLHRPMLKYLYDHNVDIEILSGSLVLSVNGVFFNARCYDDVNFVDELFFKSAYNVISAENTCIIDVGMNIGLASLIFAAKPQVREVHAFEPFPSTYARGLANLSLNPALASKIKTNNFGLSDKNEDTTFLVHETSDSGARSTRDQEGGTPTNLSVRDAATVLGPIIASARSRGLQVIAKIDCEGSEFPVFQSLAKAGLFSEITALMVEWHRVFEGRTQRELIQPLTDAGFISFDLTPPHGNGFFYAVKAV